MQTLVIVESGKKGKTIQKLLGDEYKVVACGGHIRDMVKDGSLGFNRETLEIDYEISQDKKIWIHRIKKAVDNGTYPHVILASDPDREGEAIAVSLKEEIGLQDTQYERCKFNEITKEAVLKAIKGHSQQDRELIDYNLVNAQEARRILDRYIGWIGTENLSDTIMTLAPVGRVQTQALRFIVEREDEINNFKPTNFYQLQFISKDKAEESGVEQWCSNLDTVASKVASEIQNGESFSQLWVNAEQANNLHNYLKTKPQAVCIKNHSEQRSKNPPPPFTTTTMQQAAINNLGLSGKEIDKIAQELYQEGFITYPRTDSTRLSDEGFLVIQNLANKNEVKILENKRETQTSDNAQDAHECIRPAVFDKEPTELGKKHVELFNLIVARAIISQMPSKVYEHHEVHFKVPFDGNDFIFKTVGNITIDPGFTEFYKKNKNINDQDEDSNDEVEHSSSVPNIKEGDVVHVFDSNLVEKTTRKPPRLTQAKLNRILDKHGIGRPSTYSSIFEKIIEHKYVDYYKGKSKAFEIKPTELGTEVVETTKNIFQIMKPEYTKEMEDVLDLIANGQKDKKPAVDAFLKDFDEDIIKLSNFGHKKPVVKCTIENCAGILYEYYTKKNENTYKYWRCKECKKVHFMINGEITTPENAMRPFLNTDGTAKHPCPECNSALRRIKKKDDGYFWACSNNLLDKSSKKKPCQYKINDYDEKPDFDNKSFAQSDKKRIAEQIANNWSQECGVCGDTMAVFEIKPKDKSKKESYFYAVCQECHFTLFAPKPKDGEKPWPFSTKYIANEVIPNLDIENEKPKVPCPDCSGALYKRQYQDKTKVLCSSVYKSPNSRYCSIKEEKMTVEEFDELIENYKS